MALAATLVLSVDALVLRFFILDRHSRHTIRLRPQDRGVSCLVRWSLRRHSPFEACAGWAGADPQEWGRDHMQHRTDLVIPPILMGLSRRIHAAVFSFIAGVIPPMTMLGRSLL
jgi:hypothetical protein